MIYSYVHGHAMLVGGRWMAGGCPITAKLTWNTRVFYGKITWTTSKYMDFYVLEKVLLKFIHRLHDTPICLRYNDQQIEHITTNSRGIQWIRAIGMAMANHSTDGTIDSN